MILQQLRGRGMMIRTQDFFASRRGVLGLERFEEGVRATPKTQRVPRAFINPNPGWMLKEKYLYRFEILGADVVTGEGVIQFFAIRSPTELTVGAAESLMLSMIVGQEEAYRILIEEANLRQVIQR